MRAGNLDRSIVIQAFKITGTDSHGESVGAWEKIHTSATISAALMPSKGTERYTRQQVVGKAVTTFRIRWRPDVSVLNRIVYNGQDWDIHSTQEVGRREGLDIDATARSDQDGA